jgi:hypothetical protein
LSIYCLKNPYCDIYMTLQCEQQELALFDPPTFGALLSKKGINNLTVIFNSRLKRGWRVKIHSFSQKRTLTIPSHFENAPEPVKNALIDWALISTIKKRKKESTSLHIKKSLERLIWEYAGASGNLPEKVFRIHPGRFQTSGLVYDLQEEFIALNNAYFEGKLTSYIRWNKSFRRSYQTTFRNPDGVRCNLISIAQAYNRPDVPRFAIESIVYHEMLHIAVPPYKSNSRNIIHGREFRLAEHSFPHYKKWREWEKKQFAI